MTVHGSAFMAAGRALMAALADRPAMSAWNVRYDPPRTERDVTGPTGARLAVWVDPEGTSTAEVTSLPNGYTETCDLVVVIEAVDPMSACTQASIDELAASAAGELLDLLAENPRLTGVDVPDGWDIAWVRCAGTRREGGPIAEAAGFGRRIEMQLAVQASRC